METKIDAPVARALRRPATPPRLILTKLRLEPADSTINQRVAAVLSFLRSYNPSADR